MASVYFGLIRVDPSIEAKIRARGLTGDLVREALQWPAEAEYVVEEHPDHGLRWIALGSVMNGRQVIAWLLPEPLYMESRADTWVLKSARWV